MNFKELEVEQLKTRVKDLELQNSALRSKQSGNSSLHQEAQIKHLTRRRVSSDGEDDLFDLSAMDTLDDDMEWLYSSPESKKTDPLSTRILKKKMWAVFESSDVLPRRRALSHKLRDIEKEPTPSPTSPFPFTNGVNHQSAPSSSSLLSTQSPSSSSTDGSQSSLYTSTEQAPEDKDVMEYMQSVLGKESESSAVGLNNTYIEPALPKHASEQHLAPPGTTGYNTGTFTRPKQKIKKSPVKDMVENQVSSSSSSTGSPTNADSLNSDTHHDTPTKYKRATKKPRENAMAAGDSSTYVLTRNKTHTVDSSAVLEAQRRLTDSPNSLDHSDGDCVGALPENTFKRRMGARQEDTSKRESLDIQTLAKLQEQSLRDSLTAVRKASTSSASSSGVPGLNFSDLDSSTGSISSSNDESLHQNAEEKSMQGSGTFRIRKSSGHKIAAPAAVEHNGDTPILHKSVINSRADRAVSKQGPQIKSSLSPRSLHSPKTSGLRKPNTAIPGKTKSRTGSIPVPAGRTGLKPPMSVQYSSR
ncbi:uncharacterized protein [Watersipora subatra]|uniref:uncharacterized protein isoform X2 n=1 Tax=Watersipora subatra TaxID=2589382 RepID=UPI00355B9E9B